jgi:hypothetical protein
MQHQHLAANTLRKGTRLERIKQFPEPPLVSQRFAKRHSNQPQIGTDTHGDTELFFRRRRITDRKVHAAKKNPGRQIVRAFGQYGLEAARRFFKFPVGNQNDGFFISGITATSIANGTRDRRHGPRPHREQRGKTSMATPSIER